MTARLKVVPASENDCYQNRSNLTSISLTNRLGCSLSGRSDRSRTKLRDESTPRLSEHLSFPSDCAQSLIRAGEFREYAAEILGGTESDW